jgi:cyclase
MDSVNNRMVKKRVIFTLLFDNGNYMLSRNFRLQRVGNLSWLKKNYKFSKITCSVDEMIILNVGRKEKNHSLFLNHLSSIAQDCYIPIAVGGGIRTVQQARDLLREGGDKVVINTALYSDERLVLALAEEFGAQCVVGSVDVKMTEKYFTVFVENGSKQIETPAEEFFESLIGLPIGDIYLNSMDRDGTGQGFLIDLVDLVPETNSVPLILAGGAGNYRHLSEGLKLNAVDAVATAHLFNFVSDGLEKARKDLIFAGFDLAVWHTKT